MTLLFSSSLSREWMLTGRSSGPAPASRSSLAVSRRSKPRISSCSASRQTKASFERECGFSPCKLNRAEPLAAGAVWFLSTAQSRTRGPSITAGIIKGDTVGFGSMAPSFNTDDGQRSPIAPVRYRRTGPITSAQPRSRDDGAISGV